MFQESVRHCLARLTVFSGRDAPRQLWPFTGLVLGAGMVIWIVGFAGSFVGIFGKIQKFAAEHPDQVTVTQGPGQYSVQVHGYHPELMPDFGMILGLMAAIVLMIAIMLGAAIVRRLHDSNWPGWIALVPLGLLLSGLAMMLRFSQAVRQQQEPDMNLFLLIFANNLAYIVSLVGLAYLLIRKGTQGPNRFGEASQ
jgi:uncharacterized membrane protein YhaH (DUF805 family)